MSIKLLFLVIALLFFLSGCGSEAQYSGDTLDGLPHGKGTLIYQGGATYSGEFVHGKREGYGTWSHQSGISYRGGWKNDLYHGYGTLSGPDGQSYEGDWHLGLRHGYGVQVWVDGRRYEGQWENDLMHGRGTITYSDGSVFSGSWIEGRKSGEGMMITAEGETLSGTWEGDQHLYVPVEIVFLSSENIILTLGDPTYQLDARIAPADATRPEIDWDNSNPEVVAIDEGAITPLSPGTATITVSAVADEASARCLVTVLPEPIPVSELRLNRSLIAFSVEDEPETIEAIISPGSATNRTVYWSSSNPEVATVSAFGRVTPRQAGRTEITARTEDGGFTATCTVIVRNPIGQNIFGGGEESND